MLSPNIHGKDPAACAGVHGSYPLLCHLLDTALVAGILWDTRVRPGLRERICTILGVDDATARQVMMLAAGLHDIGKANPFFQYQERVGATSDFAAQLQELLDLPSTPWRLRERLKLQPPDPPTTAPRVHLPPHRHGKVGLGGGPNPRGWLARGARGGTPWLLARP